MAKKPIQVDRAILENAIQVAEKENKFSTLTALWQDVAKRYNNTAMPTKPLSESVVMIRAKEWKLNYETKPGKRGGDGSQLIRAPRTTRANKFKRRKDSPDAFTAMRKRLQVNNSERFLPLIERIEQGSLTAAVKLHCLDCCAYQTPEVRRCGDISCGLFLFRPYQGAVEEDEQVPEELTVEAA